MKKIVQIFWALSISVAIASNQLKFESLIESNISNNVSISKFGEPTSRNPQDFEGLLFSEYAEGSSYNKYLEIYNGTGADLDLSDYSISSCTMGVILKMSLIIQTILLLIVAQFYPQEMFMLFITKMQMR